MKSSQYDPHIIISTDLIINNTTLEWNMESLQRIKSIQIKLNYLPVIEAYLLQSLNFFKQSVTEKKKGYLKNSTKKQSIINILLTRNNIGEHG